MPRKKVAIIGTGGRSCAYAAPYAQCEDIDIVALADPNAPKLRPFGTPGNGFHRIPA